MAHLVKNWDDFCGQKKQKTNKHQKKGKEMDECK